MANLFDILNLGNQESDEDGSRDESRRTNATERIAEIHRSTEESNKFNDESANMADLQQSEDTEVVLQSSPTCSLTDDSVGENHEDHEPDHKYMPISPMKTFVIPRKKKENKDLLQSLSLDSREYARDILPMVSQHYRERSSKSTFTYQSAYLVHNADLNREFQEKRKEMKSEGRTDKELNEHYAFFCVDNIDQAKDICQLGLRINSSSVTCLGNSKMGVYVSRYSDLIQRNMLPAGLEAVLIIFKLMKGRVKAMTENHSWNIIEPTPNYDCHVSKSANLDITHLTAKQAFDSTQYYIYEFGELDMVERPRHLRPYAVLTFKYTPLHPNLIIPAGTPPRSRNAVTTPVIGSSPTSSVLVAKDPRILQAGQHEAMDENSYCLWSGHLTNKSKPLCKVKLVSYATPIKPVIFPSTINICKQISLDNLRKHLASKIFFKGLPINTGEKEAFIESKYYAYCEVKSSNDYRGRLWNFTKFLDSNRMAGVVNFGDVTEMILLPTCQFTVDLGITSHGYPMVLHGLFVSTKPTIKHIKFCGAHCSSSSRDDSIYMPSESIHNEAHPPRLFELRKAISIAMELQKQNFNRMSSKSLTGTFVPTHHAQYLQTPYQLENPGTKSWATPPKSKYSATESAQAPRPKNTTSSSESMLQSPQTNYPTVISPHVTHGYSTGSQSTAVKITSPTLQVNNSNNNNETNNASSPTASRSKAVKAEERSPQLQVSPLYVGSLLPDLDQLGSDDLNSLLQKLKPILGQTLQNDAPPPPEPPLPPNEGKAAKVLDKEVKVVVEKQSTVTKSNELPLKPVESTGSLDLKDLPDSPESPDSELVDHVKEPKQVLKGMEEVKSKSRVTETNIAKMDENKPIGSKLKSDDSVIMSNAALEGKAVLQSQTESGEQADIYKDDPIMDADEMKAFLEKSLIPPKIENIPSKVEIDNASDMKNYLNARFTRNLEKSSKKRKRQDSSQAMKVETEPGEKRRSVRVKLDDDNVRKFESRDVLTFTAVPGINLVGRIPKKCKLEKESSSSSEQVDKTSSTCSLRKEDPTTSIGRSEISGSSKHITKITDSSIKTDSIDISVDSYKAAKVEILKVEKKTELMDTSERLTDNKVEIDEKSVLEVLDMELDSTGEDSDEDITLSDASLILESDHEEEEESGGVAFTGHHVVVENDKQLKICRPCVSSVAPTAYAAELDTEARLLQCVSAALH
uniref:Uncharacterized protein LOC102806952 n=1 Tax=Saccoglossus kowalevskii TaxID=10224 RepID=A0ABM0MEY0_SACKO